MELGGRLPNAGFCTEGSKREMIHGRSKSMARSNVRADTTHKEETKTTETEQETASKHNNQPRCVHQRALVSLCHVRKLRRHHRGCDFGGNLRTWSDRLIVKDVRHPSPHDKSEGECVSVTDT